MGRIIVLLGQADSPFFQNELPSLRQVYDEIIVLEYAVSGGNLQLPENKEFKQYAVPTVTVGSALKALGALLTQQELRQEWKTQWKYGWKRLAYLFMYESYFQNVKKALRKETFQDTVLYAFWLSRCGYAAARLRSAYPESKIAVSRAHRYDVYEERNPSGYLPFRRYISEHLDEIEFISDQGRRYFESRYSFAQSAKLCVRRLGIETKIGMEKQMRDKQVITIASCSAVIPVKRLDLIIDTLSQVTVPFRWIHLGGGPLLEQMKERAAQKLAPERYCFLGQVNNTEILPLYEKEDVDYFINLSDSEGIPVSIMEAMAYGAVPIARDVGGVSELVSERVGLLLEGLDAQKVNAFLSLRLTREEQYRGLSIEARKVCQESYDAQTNYLQFFQHLAHGGTVD